MATAIEIRKGSVIRIGKEMYKVLDTQHVKPGKGGAFMQTELKNIKTGSKLYERFRSEESVEFVHSQARKATFMYDAGDDVEFMYADTFEQVAVSNDIIGADAKQFLTDGMSVDIETADAEIINIRLPQMVECIVSETETYIKGQTVSNSFKPAVLSNGYRITVPQFIERGEKIIVNIDTFEYSERVKNK